jgi:hypothetical protein
MVVLNQILLEIHAAKTLADPIVEQLTGRLSGLVWLDGGHNGGPGTTWVTDRAVLAHLAAVPGLRVRVRVTPYQVRDTRRPWIGKEERAFSRVLADCRALDFERRLYFDDEEPSIENHFGILTTLLTDPIGLG